MHIVEPTTPGGISVQYSGVQWRLGSTLEVVEYSGGITSVQRRENKMRVGG